MLHIKDAQLLMKQGDGAQALSIVEKILELAPRNSEALKIKAQVLDAWGRFDESMAILQQISGELIETEEGQQTLEARAFEEREASIYSELTHEGRWYFAFPTVQIWIALFGFIGCALFLLLSPQLFQGPEHLVELFVMFLVLVASPWMALMFFQLRGVKKILVGMKGICIYTRFAARNFSWDDIGFAVVEHDPNVNVDYLKLILYGRKERQPILSLDISRRSSVVRARRHFVRTILSYVDVVCYVTKNEKSAAARDKSFKDAKDAQPTTAAAAAALVAAAALRARDSQNAPDSEHAPEPGSVPESQDPKSSDNAAS